MITQGHGEGAGTWLGLHLNASLVVSNTSQVSFHIYQADFHQHCWIVVALLSV